jgi:enoyl-CoA hydratase/carnithine racemase
LTKFVTIEEGHGPEGRIAVVRFDRGDGINALSPEALRQLTDAARSFEDDAETSVVVLTGGTNAFSAGFDLRDPEARSRKRLRTPIPTPIWVTPCPGDIRRTRVRANGAEQSVKNRVSTSSKESGQRLTSASPNGALFQLGLKHRPSGKSAKNESHSIA